MSIRATEKMIGHETYFGRPETCCQRGSSQNLRNGRTKDTRACSHDRRAKGTRRLIWGRYQIFEDSDGGRAGPRERNRPKLLRAVVTTGRKCAYECRTRTLSVLFLLALIASRGSPNKKWDERGKRQQEMQELVA